MIKYKDLGYSVPDQIQFPYGATPEAFAKLAEKLDSLYVDFFQFYWKNNKASARRIRIGLAELEQMSKEIRSETSEIQKIRDKIGFENPLVKIARKVQRKYSPVDELEDELLLSDVEEVIDDGE